jgi:hypothetical protein
MKDMRKATHSPIAIITPKSITGRIPLSISDPNATIVVKAVYRRGSALVFTVSDTRKY